MRTLLERPKLPPVTNDDGYVHDPANFDERGQRRTDDEDGERDDGAANDASTSGNWVEEPAHPAEVDREFGWRGWILVGAIVLAFVVAPALILWRPPVLPYRVTLLVLPLVPAVLLAVVAVWATTRP